MNPSFKFYEFFCGGGMARAGLGSNWECIFANDIDPKKAESYQNNWGGDTLKVSDVALVQTKIPSYLWQRRRKRTLGLDATCKDCRTHRFDLICKQ